MATDKILDHVLSNFQSSSNSISGYGDGLRSLGYRVCTLERLPEEIQVETGRPRIFEVVTLRDLLDEIVRMFPEYQWKLEHNTLINIYPTESPLDIQVPSLSIERKGVTSILLEDLAIEDKGIVLFQEFGDVFGPVVDLKLTTVDLRDALNAIVVRLKRAIWHISGRPEAYYITISDIPKPDYEEKM